MKIKEGLRESPFFTSDLNLKGRIHRSTKPPTLIEIC